MNESRSFQGIWIPKEIWLNPGLTPTEKFLLAEINSLDKGNGCIASNQYLAKFCQVSQGAIANYLTKFRKMDLIIDKGFNGRRRKISINNDSLLGRQTSSYDEPYKEELLEKNKPPISPLKGGRAVEGKSNGTAPREDGSTVENKPSPPATEKETEKIPYSEIVADLNTKTGSDFKPTSQASRRMIRARFREGFRLLDFKHVHTVKCAEWLNDPKMRKFLCPGTLYRPSNFEKYLNQKAQPDPNAFRYGKETKPEIPEWRIG